MTCHPKHKLMHTADKNKSLFKTTPRRIEFQHLQLTPLKSYLRRLDFHKFSARQLLEFYWMTGQHRSWMLIVHLHCASG